ncbi:MAG: hypothetical protein M1815_004332 [Lichina confinis]|nr:MAG: hypothetical protein M1815_004332 [Lichina confinis]
MPISKNEYLSEAWRAGLFNDKVVFCTGGAGTICSAQVRALVHLGANACIVGRNVDKTERMAIDIATARLGAKVLGIGNVDVRNYGNLQNAAETCFRELGGIDYLIAGAAGNFLAPITQLSANAFKTVIDIDVLGSFNAVKATLPHILKSAQRNKDAGQGDEVQLLIALQTAGTGGRVIFVSATMHYTGCALQSHVSVAKAGIDALSNTMAIELGPRGVTSNVIAPGPIAGTEGLERLAKKGGAAETAAAQAKIPVGRWGQVKDIADATVWLFSDAAGFVNGSTVVVDGGAWRADGTRAGTGFPYPDFLLSNQSVTGVKTDRKAKL